MLFRQSPFAPRRNFHAIISRIFKLCLLLALCAGLGRAQTNKTTDGTTPAGVAPGAPAGSYALSGIENVNLFNGHLNVSLPLLAVGGRGAAGYRMTLAIDRKWMAERSLFNGQHYFDATTEEWLGHSEPGYGPGLMQLRHSLQSAINNQPGPGCHQNDFYRTLPRLTFTGGDGTEYEFFDTLTGGQAWPITGCLVNHARGRVFITGDGSGTTFISDEDIYDEMSNAMLEVNGYLLMKDGTRYRIVGGVVGQIEDRQGNRVTFNHEYSPTRGWQMTSATDSLGRQVTVAYDVNDGAPYGVCDRITFTGAGGATRILRVSRTPLANALVAGQTLKSTYEMFSYDSHALENPTVVSALWLPNGQAYQFRYNSYSDVARLTLPTGGVFEYDFAGWQVFSQRPAIQRRLSQRREYADGVTLTARRNIIVNDPGTVGGVQTTTVEERDPTAGDALLSRSVHYFHGSARGSLNSTAVSYSRWREGKEFRTEVFAADGVTLLRREETNWQQPVWGAGWPLAQAETSETVRPNNPLATSRAMTLADGNLVSAQTSVYDRHFNPTDAYEYAYGTGAAGPLLRHSHTDFLAVNPANGVNYADPANGAAYALSDPHIRNLPAQSWVSPDLYGTVKQTLTQYEYDVYGGPNHAGLVDRANVTGHDTAVNTASTARGNVTATTSYTDAQLQAGAVTAYAQYDILGNVVKAIDARGKAATVNYEDCFGGADANARNCAAPAQLPNGQQTFAFATSATNALGYTSYAQFDYNLGAAVEAEDANGVVSSTFFDNDPLDRPRRGVSANNVTALRRQTLITYDDAGRKITQQGDIKAFGDGLAKSEGFYDGLGRTTETRSYIYETNAAYITGLTEYDALGRVKRASNPFKPGQAVTWTTSQYDALSRVTAITTPDGAQVQTFYDGVRVLVKDPAGKQRMSQTDALGRLTDVWEITVADGATEAVSFPNQPTLAAGYRTNYGYDILGNLLQVNQGGQTRYFLYDSLSRLRAAKNPEQGALTRDGDFANLPAGAAGWSMAYLYDAGGNLLKRRDARNIETNYTYDDLNRNTLTTYSDGTPTVTRRYDPAVAYGKGKLWQTETAATAQVTVSNFDALGRPATLQQKFWQTGLSDWNAAPAYTVSREYNLATLKNQTYPSGHVVNYEYDDAGRLADKNAAETAFRGNLGDGVNRSYAKELQYGVYGLEQETYGMVTPLYHRMSYNKRGQMTDMQLGSGTGADAYNRGRIQNFYAGATSNNVTTLLTEGPNNNGNLLGQDNSIPNYAGATGPTTFRQVYDYDNLNRLKGASEYYNGGATAQWRQQFDYDRWGNRTINQAATTNGVPKPDFTCDTTTNRLLPGPTMPGQMQYDQAGNLTTDTATGTGGRVFDAENRMTSAQGNVVNGVSVTQFYTYDGDGRRIIRGPYQSGVWQVYGFEGELLAEYAANSLKILPQKEYGYVGGKLLITANGGDDNRLRRFVENLYYRTWGYLPAGKGQTQINQIVTALGVNGQANTGAMLQAAKDLAAGLFDSSQYANVTRTHEQYVADLYLAYLQRPPEPGAIPWYAGFLNNGQLTRLQLRNEFANGPEFAGIVNALWGSQSGDYDRVDRLINQVYTAATGNLPSGGQRDGERGRFDLAEAKGLNEVQEAGKALGRDLLGANVGYRMDLSATEYVTRLYQTFLRRTPDTDFSANVTQAATPSGRNTVLEAFLSKAAYTERSGALYREIFWLISDHLGTPRLIAERTGKLEGIKRSDYLPYGESANALGGRAQSQGYAGESVRQGFTGYEEDAETGLDFAQARYLSSPQGRFISVDPLLASASTGEPQSWNRYVYVSNNPLNLTDPTGMLQKPPVASTITADHVRSDSQTKDGKVTQTPQTPPPPIKVKVEAADPAIIVNSKLPNGKYISGVGSALTITITDDKDKPLAGAKVTESVVAVGEKGNILQRESEISTDSKGQINDVVAKGGISDKPVPFGAAGEERTVEGMTEYLNEEPITSKTEQTLNVTTPDGKSFQVSYQRTLTNVGADGNINPKNNANGVNYTITVTTPVIKPVKPK